MPGSAPRSFALPESRCPIHSSIRTAAAVCALLVAFSYWQPDVTHAQAESCEMYRITGYVRGAFSPWTYDGTSVWTTEPIAAASWNVPVDSIVQVQGLGQYRVADRGSKLEQRHIDILVNSKAEAYSLTGWRPVCVLKFGNPRSPVNARAVDGGSNTLSAAFTPTTSQPRLISSQVTGVPTKP